MSIHYDVHRPGPTEGFQAKPLLILIHGGALSGRMYKDMIAPLLSLGYTVVTPDLPEHGKSVGCGPFSFDTSTKQLHQLVSHLKSGEEAKQKKIVLVGVSLGAQAVLDLLAHHPGGGLLVDAALVSGASIHPPDEAAQWEMPHMPDSPEWIQLMTDDVNIMGMENAPQIQAASFAFTFTPPTPPALPPVLVMVGQEDTKMSRRDFDELAALAKAGNPKSKAMVLQQAWHNHPIDVPERFVAVIDEWVKEVCG